MTMTTERPKTAAPHNPAHGAPVDRTKQLIRWISALLAVLIVGFGAFYWYDQRPVQRPSMNAQAIAQAEAAVRKTPNNVDARLALATAYELDNRFDDAIAQCDEVLKVAKGDRRALLARGYAYYLKNDLDKSAADYAAVIKAGVKGEFAGADKLLQEAHYYLGTIREKQGKHQAALDELNLALKIDKTDSDALYQVGLALMGLDRTKEAVDVFNKAVLFVPTGWPEPYEALVTAYTKLGQKDQAALAQALVSAAKDDPEGAKSQLKGLLTSSVKVDALIHLAALAQVENDGKAAIGYYEQALKADPKNEAAKQGLAALKSGKSGMGSPMSPSTAPTNTEN